MVQFVGKYESKAEDDPDIKPEAGSETLSASMSIPFVKAEEDAEVCIEQKEQIVQLSLASLARLKALMETSGHAFPECRSWAAEAGDNITIGQMPRTAIGLLGYTGCERLLPTNGMRASTSVVVELSYNTSEDRKQAYTAEVEFCTSAEWLAEFNTLRADIIDMQDGETLASESTPEVEKGAAKLQAVYPGIEMSKLLGMTNNEIVRDPNIQKVLGQSRMIYCATAREFQKAIKPYVDSVNTASKPGDFAYWPLVRLVKVAIKADILKQGLVLVDLPGVGDSNAGRSLVAENYMKNLNHVWVLADIKRAVDDKIAEDLLGNSFKTQLLMNGKYDDTFVTFIMTRIDDIDTTEVMDTLDLSNTVLSDDLDQDERLATALEEAVREFTNNAKQVPKQPQSGLKRKRGEINDINQEQNELQSRITVLEQKLADLNRSMRTKCIHERSQYSQDRLRDDFKRGLISLLREIADSALGDVQYPILDQAFINSLAAGLKTFCVSAKGYQKLRGKLTREPEIPGFSCLKDTGIPSLLDFAVQCTLKSREAAADKFRTEFSLWKSSVKFWAEEGQDEHYLSSTQREKLLEHLNKHDGTMVESVKKSNKNMRRTIQRAIRKGLITHLEKAVAVGTAKVELVARVLAGRAIPCGTLKAILRRHGETYQSRNKTTYYFNEDLTSPYMKPLLVAWHDIFRKRIPLAHAKYLETIIEALKAFETSFTGSVGDVCGSYPPIQRILARIQLEQDRISTVVANSLTLRQGHADDVRRTMPKHIKRHMVPFYDEAKQFKGRGTAKRITSDFTKHVENTSSDMYTSASLAIIKELNRVDKALLHEPSRAVHNILEKIVTDLRNLINRTGMHDGTGKTNMLKLDLRRHVLREIDDLETRWGETINSNQESQLNAKNTLNLLKIPVIDLDEEYVDFDDEEDEDFEGGEHGKSVDGPFHL